MFNINFTAHFQHVRPARAGKPLWDIVQSTQIFRHIFADAPVPSCGTLDQNTFFITQSRRQTVNFRFSRKSHGRFGIKSQKSFGSRHKIRDIFRTERIAEAQHGNGMGNFAKTP